MPFKSQAQAGYFHTHKAQLERQGVDVDEWDAATKGKHLPERAGDSPRRGTLKMKVKQVNLGSKGSFDVKKGALHEALGIPLGEKIPASDKEPKTGDSPRVRRMKASAKGFAGMKH